MKKSFVLLVMGLLFYSGVAQNNKQDAIALEKEMVRFAKSMGDVSVTTSSMYRLVVLEGENSTYKDSLTYIYYSSRKYASCFLMSNEVLKRDPQNKAILELKALALESLGAIDKSMEAFKDLFAVSKNNFHGYNLAKLQLTMKQYDEAYKTILEVEAINDAGIYKVNFAINKNHTQEVELLAAIPYLKALIEIDLDKIPDAKLSLEKALKIQADFVLARETLDGLNKE
jgi:tetratricopeptide (TPR) repeat protein